MTITDDDVKTRAQKDKLEEISAPAPSNGDNGGDNGAKESSPPPKVPRDNTMEVTAKV